MEVLTIEQRQELHRQALQQAEVQVENARLNLIIAESALSGLREQLGFKRLLDSPMEEKR